MKVNNIAVLLLSSVPLLCLEAYVYYAKLGICDEYNFFLCDFYMSDINRITNFLLIISITSFVLLFLSEKYFISWLRFAWWGGLITIGTIIYVNVAMNTSPSDPLGGVAENVATFLAYIFFIAGSLIQLFRTYLKSR